MSRTHFCVTDDMGRDFAIVRDDRDACMAESDTPEGWTCSRPKGHAPDLHVACTFHEERRGHPPDCIVWQWTAELPRHKPVTDPDLDAPDGAVLDGFHRVGDMWHRLPVTERTRDGELEFVVAKSRSGTAHAPVTFAMVMPDRARWWTDVVDAVHTRGDAIRAAYALIDPTPVCGLLAMACELMRGDKKAGRAPIHLGCLPKNGTHHAR